MTNQFRTIQKRISGQILKCLSVLAICLLAQSCITQATVQCLPDPTLIRQLGIQGAAKTNGELLNQLIDMKFERELDNKRKQLLVRQLEQCMEL